MSDFAKALSVSIAHDSTTSGNSGGNGTISWQLADIPVFDADVIPAGETLKLYYTVTLTDSQGATDTRNHRGRHHRHQRRCDGVGSQRR